MIRAERELKMIEVNKREQLLSDLRSETMIM